MSIQTEQQITGAIAKEIRGEMSQRAFWESVGVTQSGGCRYEGGSPIPKRIRTMIFLKYVAGIELDASTPEGAAACIRLGKLQASELAGNKEKIGATLQNVMGHVQAAKDGLKTI